LTQRTRYIVIGVAVVVVLAVAGGVFALSSGGGGDKKQATTTVPTTTIPATTTTKAPPIAPLTGLVDPSGASLTRPAMSVKVENTDQARPQAGIDQADVLYEEVVEGNITRFIAIFNSQIPDVIGPVRSVRAEDPDIVWPIGGIFAYSGGAQVNVNAIDAAPVNAVDESAAQANGAMQRNAQGQPPRDAPHNLYAIGPKMIELGGDPKPPPALFQYLPNDAPPVAGTPVVSMRIGFIQGYDPTYTWDAGSKTWKRTQSGVPFTVVGGAQIAPTNVVVQFTHYANEGEGQTVGEGDVWVFSDGVVRKGRWVRPDKTQPAKYVDANGLPILLRPGRTWVELLPSDAPVDVVEGPPVTTVPVTVPPATTTTKKPKKK
jgi:Protein of unknown function (DUF3048) N-terminal domain/Protein of unknown function (DUF3048) C-terminal domain